MLKRIVIAILLLPLAEIAVFVLVVATAGFAWALILTLLTSLAGFLVLRHAGRGKIARFRVAVADTDVAGIQANTGGFLTDLIGAVLLIGPVRRWCGRTVRRWIRRRNPADRSTIDLAPGEWQQMPDRELPPHRRDRH